jgi:hypothetical protein
VLVIAVDEPGKRPALCDALLQENPSLHIIAVAPQQNYTVCYWATVDIRSDDFEPSEEGFLNAVRRVAEESGARRLGRSGGAGWFTATMRAARTRIASVRPYHNCRCYRGRHQQFECAYDHSVNPPHQRLSALPPKEAGGLTVRPLLWRTEDTENSTHIATQMCVSSGRG